jgi:hypothetical protein
MLSQGSISLLTDCRRGSPQGHASALEPTLDFVGDDGTDAALAQQLLAGIGRGNDLEVLPALGCGCAPETRVTAMQESGDDAAGKQLPQESILHFVLTNKIAEPSADLDPRHPGVIRSNG